MGSAAVLLGVVLLTISAGPLFAQTAEPAPAPAAPATGLPGVYECQGISADGREYRGAVIAESARMAGPAEVLSTNPPARRLVAVPDSRTAAEDDEEGSR